METVREGRRHLKRWMVETTEKEPRRRILGEPGAT